MKLPRCRGGTGGRLAAVYHGAFVVLYIGAIVFHVTSAVAYWREK